MIKDKNNILISRLFQMYISFIMKRHFSGVEVFGKYTVNDKPVLLTGNHFSWWDGFIALYINNNFLKSRKFRIMMLEDELKKKQILRYSGAFSINPGNRSVLESLNYCREVLEKTNNTLVYYPEGKIQSKYSSNFKWKKGFEWILRDLNVQVVFYSAFVDYFSQKKPKLYIYLKEIEGTQNDYNNAYNEFYKDCMNQQINANS